MELRIRDLREDADLSQQEIADLLNVSQTTYSRYECGVLDIPYQSLIILAQYYGLSVGADKREEALSALTQDDENESSYS